ncbi:MAG: hypothetical protein ACKOD2_14985 [Ilumatobacteraceae bacterium]
MPHTGRDTSRTVARESIESGSEVVRVSGETSSGVGTVSVIVFVVLASGPLTEFTIRASVVAGLALVALLVIGWRQPARARRSSPRTSPGDSGHDETRTSVDSPPVSTGERWARRTLDAFGLGVISLIGGILLAIVLALAVSTLVTNFVDRL